MSIIHYQEAAAVQGKHGGWRKKMSERERERESFGELNVLNGREDYERRAPFNSPCFSPFSFTKIQPSASLFELREDYLLNFYFLNNLFRFSAVISFILNTE